MSFRSAIRTTTILAMGLSLQLGYATPVWAQAAATGADAAAAASARPVLVLGPGDRVTVTVFGLSELSGELTLDSQGNVVLPIGGTIQAANLTTEGLERKITETLVDGYVNHPRVSVRISELRPIYVLGDVRAGGAVAYKFGMNVLTAIALAGGIGSPQDSMGLRSELVSTEERLQVLLDQRIALRGRIARLTAQRDGAATLDFPPDLDADNPDRAPLLKGERSVFDSERAAEMRQIAMLTQQMKDADAEIASINEQIQLAKQQLSLITGYLGDLSKLARSGLVERRRVIDMQQEQARLEASIALLNTQSLRAAQIIREAPLRMSDVRAAAHQRALVGLQEANTRLAELDTSVEASRELATVRRDRVGIASLGRSADTPRLEVTRAGVDGPKTIEAQETTALLPGDILRVTGAVVGSQASGFPGASRITQVRRQ